MVLAYMLTDLLKLLIIYKFTTFTNSPTRLRDKRLHNISMNIINSIYLKKKIHALHSYKKYDNAK